MGSSLPIRGSWLRRAPRAGHRRRAVVVNVGSGQRPTVLFGGWSHRRSYWNLLEFANMNAGIGQHTVSKVLSTYRVDDGKSRVSFNDH
jgi:hypothetical protein